MAVNKTIDQQIAVFGQSGSGKTVLLCSFYGSARGVMLNADNQFELNAKDDRHTTLISSYLGMKEDCKVPLSNRFKSNKTVFLLKQKGTPLKMASNVEQLRLTWFDYPGEWFEGGATTDSERKDKAQTFRELLGADVALFLVDGQKLRDYEGEEERYLRYLFDSFHSSLGEMQDDILSNGGQLDQFPRVWVIALSKADLWPEMCVSDFENLLNKKAANEINALRSKLLEFINNDEAFSFGKDFLLLSSAKFTPGSIDTSQQTGVDVLLPLASVLPIQRHLWWQELKVLPIGMAEKLIGNDIVQFLAPKAIAILRSTKFSRPKAMLLVAAFANLVEEMADQSSDSLLAFRDDAMKKRDFLRALVAEFTRKLQEAEEKQILVRDSQ